MGDISLAALIGDVMSKLSKLRVARAIADTVDRISSSITAACVVAALLKPAMTADLQIAGDAVQWGAIFIALSITASVVKAMLESTIAKVETNGGDA